MWFYFSIFFVTVSIVNGCESRNGTECTTSNKTACDPGNCKHQNGTLHCCPVTQEAECRDRVKFCANLKKLCLSRNFTAHRKVLARECASTCGHCKPPTNTSLPFLRQEPTHKVNETEIYNKEVLRAQPNALNLNVSCSEETTGECATLDGNIRAQNDTGSSVYTANMTVVIGAGHRVRSVDLKISESKRKAVHSLEPNESLKTFATKKKEELGLQVEAVEDSKEKINTQIEEKSASIGRNGSYEMRKIKLQELMSSADLKLPRVTRAPVDTISISLAKTLIRGTCFDEYLYCSEFSSLCTHSSFGDVMSLHCTMTCRRCDDVDTEHDYDDNCSDLSTDCNQYKDVCNNDRYVALTKEYCSKTCGHCQPKCRDRHQNCAEFARDGFCSDEMYTLGERTHLCGNTCNFCTN